jgi:hypothetical protein
VAAAGEGMDRAFIRRHDKKHYCQRRRYHNTLDKAAAYNLNIIKKMAINTLRLVDVGIVRISMKNKRYIISMNFMRYLDILMAL